MTDSHPGAEQVNAHPNPGANGIMPSAQFVKVRELLRQRRGQETPSSDPLVLRQRLEAVALPVEEGVSVTELDLGGVRVERVAWRDVDSAGGVLYLHGGGFCLGSPRTHRKLAADISRSVRLPCFVVDYRLAPEHPFPAAIVDAAAAYAQLIRAIPAASLAVMGDSAGATLAVLALVEARAQGLTMPAAAVLLTPWVDYLCSDPAYTELADADPVADVGQLSSYHRWFLDGAEPTDPTVCAATADLTGLPPLLIHGGGGDVMHNDAARLAENARRACVDVTYREAPYMMHVWHVFAGRVPESSLAMLEVGAFVRNRLQLS